MSKSESICVDIDSVNGVATSGRRQWWNLLSQCPPQESCLRAVYPDALLEDTSEPKKDYLKEPVGPETNGEKAKRILRKYGLFVGPGILISVAYMDPGNYATCITAGAGNQYSLLFIVLLANIIAVFLQSLCIKLGSVTGHDLARCCRDYCPRWLNLSMWVLAECAIIATDVAEVIGSAIALNILIKVPLPAGVVITIVDVLFVLMAYHSNTSSMKVVRYFEFGIATLVFAVVICFAIELSHITANVKDVFRGWVPSAQMISGQGVTIAVSVIGATVMIHSLFLGSGIVQPRLREYDVANGYILLEKVRNSGVADVGGMSEKQIKSARTLAEEQFFYNEYRPSYAAINFSYKYSIIELAVLLFTVAMFVNASILIVAGATLYGTEEAMDADLYTIHGLLSRTIAPVVGTIFMLALLFSGQSAGIVCTMAGQIVSEGHINWTCKPWIRRLATRAISIVPCLVISVCIGRSGLSVALNVSQVVISIILPPLTAPLIYFTSNKRIMTVEVPYDSPDPKAFESEGKKYVCMSNAWYTTGFAIAIWLLVSALNVYAIYQMAVSGI